MSQAATTSISRESVLQLGKSGKPWDFLAMMRQIGSAADGEPAIVFVHAANLAKLGLKEMAAERLRILPPAVKAIAEVKNLIDVVEGMASARMVSEELLRNFDASGRVLVGRRVTAESDVLRWRGMLEEEIEKRAVYRTTEGNVVIAGELEEDGKGRARGLITSEVVAEYPAALLIENLLPPWLLVAAAERYTKNAQGFWRRLMVVHEDERTLGLGLAVADVSKVLEQERVRVYLGAGALEGVKNFVQGHRDELLISRLVSLRMAQGADTTLSNTIISGTDAQLEELKELKERVEARYAARDKAYWAKRYQEATNGGKPLRVLVPTTRYSTFLQHSSRDIVEAFKAIGHEAKLLIEPEDCSILAANVYWRAFDEFDPDLEVLINFPRPLRLSTTPANVPYVTWLQDAMPHLFDKSLGKQMGPLDFSCGYLFDECFQSCGWDRDQAVSIPILVNDRKFNDAPVVDRPDLECEVAFASNRAETPDQMHARLTAIPDQRLVAAMNAIRSEINNAVATAHTHSMWATLEKSVGSIAERLGLDAAAATLLHHTYAIPMAGQVFRHQGLKWAQEICQRRNWRFHLYGKGWETHPDFAAHARGPLAHGEELRAGYQLGAVQLHLDPNTLTHQRVLECMLSGGFIASRMAVDVLRELTIWGARMMNGVPADAHNGTYPCWEMAKYPPLALIARIREELGVPPVHPNGLWIYADPRKDHASESGPYPDYRALDCTWIFGDLRAVTFHDPTSLERLLERNIEDRGARNAVSSAVAARIRETLTYPATCRRLVDFISQRLRGTL